MKKKSLPATQTKRRNSPDVTPAAFLRSRERLRRHYLPKRVRILFVGEAPPASGRFFYQADYGLYRAIRATFEAAYPALRSADGDFLVSFRNLGCYLVDLCGTPVDKLDPKSRLRVCKAGEKRLAGVLRRLKPAMVVTLVRSIASNVQGAEAAADWSGLHLELPYPGRWHHLRLKFRRKLIPLLRTTLGRKFSLQSPP
jgi:hypothetical protein